MVLVERSGNEMDNGRSNTKCWDWGLGLTLD